MIGEVILKTKQFFNKFYWFRYLAYRTHKRAMERNPQSPHRFTNRFAGLRACGKRFAGFHARAN